MKWLAWDPADGNRNSARRMTGGSALANAKEFAARCYAREPFAKYMDVTVVRVVDDGTETEHLFTVDVDHEPVFRARPR